MDHTYNALSTCYQQETAGEKRLSVTPPPLYNALSAYYQEVTQKGTQSYLGLGEVGL